jgi:hypothetical protein
MNRLRKEGKLKLIFKMNPFEKYLGKEDRFHHQLITWLQYQYPKLRYHHSPNEGKRSKFEQFKYKYLGSDSGFPDLIFPSIELVIELKVKPNKTSQAQDDWLHFFASIGWTALVCYDFETAKKIIVGRMKDHGQIAVLPITKK